MRPSAAVLLALTLSACAAPMMQAPLTPPSGFAGPRIEQGAHGVGAFVASDGARLPFLRWTPAGEPKIVIVALHGMNDHAGSWRLAGPWWAEQGIETWAYDQRGFGGAPEPGVWAGEVAMVEDLRTVVALVRAERPDALIAVAGESMGGAVAISAFASHRPPAADRMVLLAPAVWGWSAQSPANGAALWVAARAMGDRSVEPPRFVTDRIRPSDNTLELVRMGLDPRMIAATRFDALAGLVDLMESASMKLGRAATPTLLAYGAHDDVVPAAAMRRALERAGEAHGLRTAWYPDGWHILNRDRASEAVFADVAAWLTRPEAPLPSGAPPVLPELRP